MQCDEKVKKMEKVHLKQSFGKVPLQPVQVGGGKSVASIPKQPGLIYLLGIGVARGCSGCRCTRRARKKLGGGAEFVGVSFKCTPTTP